MERERPRPGPAVDVEEPAGEPAAEDAAGSEVVARRADDAPPTIRVASDPASARPVASAMERVAVALLGTATLSAPRPTSSPRSAAAG